MAPNIGEEIHVVVGVAFSGEYKQEVLKDDKVDAVTVALIRDGTCNNAQ